MKPEQLRDLVRYRLEQASETLTKAMLPRDARAYRGAVNRAYYAMFYALLALLATRQVGTSNHGGAIALFDRETVRTGVFAPELSRALHRSFHRRQVHDYGEVVRADLAAADESIEDDEQFITAVRSFLAARG
jgi:uncharacterized protein